MGEGHSGGIEVCCKLHDLCVVFVSVVLGLLDVVLQLLLKLLGCFEMLAVGL